MRTTTLRAFGLLALAAIVSSCASSDPVANQSDPEPVAPDGQIKVEIQQAAPG